MIAREGLAIVDLLRVLRRAEVPSKRLKIRPQVFHWLISELEDTDLSSTQSLPDKLHTNDRLACPVFTVQQGPRATWQPTADQLIQPLDPSRRSLHAASLVRPLLNGIVPYAT